MAETAPQVTAKQPVQCAHPGCGNTFVPAHKAHRFCSRICKRRSHVYRHVLNRR